MIVLIYFCMLIPLAAVIVLAVKFQAKVTWWEYLLVFGVPAICIVSGKYLSTFMQTATPEYWNTYVTKATYYEAWDEWIHKTCYHTCYDQCRDSEGRSYQCNPHDCNPYDCSYRDYHPEYYEAEDNMGNTFSIDRGMFYELCKLWNNKTFQDLNRHYYTVDGDAYNTISDTLFSHIVPRVTKHTYENKVRCSRSVFNFADVDSEDVKEYGLYEYPPVSTYGYNPIIGWSAPEASARLQRYNAKIGAFRQVHMLILVYPNKSVQSAIYQEGYWKGGNKNEFILCIGTNGKTVSWAKVISWTEADALKIGVAKAVAAMPFDLNNIVDYMASEVTKKFVRKQFKDFSYISVEPSMTATWIILIITIVSTVGLSIFVILNDFDRSHRRYR